MSGGRARDCALAVWPAVRGPVAVRTSIIVLARANVTSGSVTNAAATGLGVTIKGMTSQRSGVSLILNNAGRLRAALGVRGLRQQLAYVGAIWCLER